MKFLAKQERQETQSQMTCSKPQKNAGKRRTCEIHSRSAWTITDLVAKIGDGKEEDEIIAANKEERNGKIAM